MALATYSDLQSAVASFLHRTDLTTQIPDFIVLAEADLQVRANLSQWETTSSLSFTTGTASLPSDFSQAISVVYGSQTGGLKFLPTTQFDEYAAWASSGEPVYYTITGSSMKISPTATGSATMRYMAGFTALSSGAPTNSLLTLFPDAYLNGSLTHANVWLQDEAAAARHGMLFEASINRIKKYMLDYKYPNGLQMRVA